MKQSKQSQVLYRGDEEFIIRCYEDKYVIVGTMINSPILTELEIMLRKRGFEDK